MVESAQVHTLGIVSWVVFWNLLTGYSRMGSLPFPFGSSVSKAKRIIFPSHWAHNKLMGAQMPSRISVLEILKLIIGGKVFR